MTLYFWDTTPARSRRTSILNTFGTLADAAIRPMLAFREALRRRRNERLLEALPVDIRKDIGYRTDADGMHL